MSDIQQEARELLDGITNPTTKWVTTWKGGKIPDVERLVRELLAENERLEDDLEAAAYRAGRQQGQYADTLRALDRVRELADSYGYMPNHQTHGYKVADQIIHAIDGEGSHE